MTKGYKDTHTEFPPLEYAKPDPDVRERAMEMAKPLTPKSERPRKSYGSLEMSIQAVRGLCKTDRKCVRQDNHDGSHWPVSRP